MRLQFPYLENQLHFVEPILPLRLFKNHTFSLTSALGFIIGAGMFGAIVMLPLYLQVVKGNTATEAGLKLIPLMIGIVSMSIFSGKRISTTGKYKIFPILGTAIMTIGLVLMSTLNEDTSFAVLSIYAVLVGAGLGLSMQTIVIALQNAVDFQEESKCKSKKGNWGRCQKNHLKSLSKAMQHSVSNNWRQGGNN